MPEPDRDPQTGSSLIVLQAGSSKRPTNTDDAPTIITQSKTAPPSDPMLGLAPGSRLGHYELIGTAGTGGMASVLRAKDLELGRDVALKILPPHMARDPENVQRFKLEARAAAKLDHDNIARVFFCGEDLGLHFIAFEFVEGETLRAMIDHRGQIPPAECVPLMLQVAAGLAHANERGVVHRDIKPSNIIITPESKAKIVDMGLARSLSQTVNGGVTQSGVTLGTFDYISPEQALDPRKADGRSDIYSLGCAFYHALTGRPPVPEGTAAKKLYAHQHDPVVDPREYNAAVPDAFAAVLAKMMAKDPAKRYASPLALIAALGTLARQMKLGTDLLPAEALYHGESTRLLPEAPKLSVGLLAGVAVLVAAVILFLGFSRPQPTPPNPNWGDPTSVSKAPPVETGSSPVLLQTPTTSRDAATAEDLVAFLLDPAVTDIRLTGKHYDLTSETKGVLVQGKRISIEGHVGTKPDPTKEIAALLGQAAAKSLKVDSTPVIRLAVVSGDSTAPRPGTLTFARSDSVRIRGVRFEFADPPVSEETPGRPVGMSVTDVSELELQECRFDSAVGIETGDLAAVSVAKSSTGFGGVTIAHCYFGLGRGTSLQFAGRLKVNINESAFAPHPAAIALRLDPEGSEAGSSELVLRHTTFLLDKGAAIEAEDRAKWAVTAGFCVFAALPPPATATMTMVEPENKRDWPTVLRVAEYKPDTIRFAGIASQRNAYFHINALATSEKIYSFDDAAELGKPAPVTDVKAIELRQSPWAIADSLALTALLKDDEPWKAFRLSSTLKPLQLPVPDHLPGVRLLPSRDFKQVYSGWPPSSQDASTDRHVQIWYPNMTPTERDTLPQNYHTELRKAVGNLQPGDTLEIKHTGDLAVPADAVFKEPKSNVIVRPSAGSRPVLVPAPSKKYEQSLFRLEEGELTLEGLEIRLTAKPGDVCSLVTVIAGKRCTLKNCLISLDEQGDEKLAAVVLADPSSVMRVGGAGPAILIENCFVRGRGRGVWAQSSRPFDLAVRNSAAALSGSLLQIDAGAKPPAAGAQVRVHFERVTAAFTAPVFDLHPGRNRQANWVPVAFDTDGCLITPLEKEIPFATIEGADSNALEKVLSWSPRSPNWYANFPIAATFVQIASADATMNPLALDAAAWFTISTEKADDSLATVTFANDPIGRKLLEIRPADLKVKTIELPKAAAKPNPDDAGADVTKLPTTVNP